MEGGGEEEGGGGDDEVEGDGEVEEWRDGREELADVVARQEVVGRGGVGCESEGGEVREEGEGGRGRLAADFSGGRREEGGFELCGEGLFLEGDVGPGEGGEGREEGEGGFGVLSAEDGELAVVEDEGARGGEGELEGREGGHDAEVAEGECS